MRTALLVPSGPSSWSPPIHEALQKEFTADVFALAPSDGFPDLSGYDLVISRLKFRHLAARGSIDWMGCSALRIHWDEDGFWDGLWEYSPYRGLWSQHFPRLGFDILVVTGERTRDYFTDLGMRTLLVHKAAGPAFLTQSEEPRDAVLGMYGSDYLSRRVARRRLRKTKVPLHQIDVPFAALPGRLHRTLATLSCTLDASIIGGPRLLPLSGVLPQRLIRTSPGPEPMLKLFESAASGCATFTDYSPDLEALGFRDGETAIVFRDLDELIEKAVAYFREPDSLGPIGERSAELCRTRHTWDVRAQDLRSQLRIEAPS